MNRVPPAELAQFWRKYQFRGGKLSRLKLANRRGELVLDLTLRVQPTGPGGAIRLKLRLVGVEEYRFAKRVGMPPARIPEARCSYLHDLVFVTLDAWMLERGEVPKALDYRASDAYVAARELWAEELPPRSPPPTS